MAKPQGVWGVDIGQCSFKAIRLEMIGGNLTATAFDFVEHPKILSQPDAEPDALIKEALQKFVSRNPVRGDLVAISVPGQSGLARFVKLPPVEETKITDIVKFEARQQIPFPLHEVVWDYQKLGSGVVTDGFAMETEIGLFAMKREMVNRYLGHFKSVDLEVHIVQMAPLALCNFVSFDLLHKNVQKEGEEQEKSEEANQSIVALDVGVDNSNLVITDGEKIIWQRPIPLGGNHFTRALSKDLKLTFAKAEHLKRNAMKSPDIKKILLALRPVLNEFVGEIQRSLGYFTSTHREAQISYLVGLGNAFRLPGLQKFLQEKLQLEVKKLPNLQRLTGESVTGAPAFTENLSTFAVAYGLAVQGLKLPRLQTNLLPEEIQFDRMIRAKKPWAIAAAASLLLGTSAMTFGEALKYREVSAEPIPSTLKDSESILANVKKWEGQCSAKESEITANEVAVKSIIAGQDERPNWLLLNQYINECLPHVNNLNPKADKIYHNGRAEEAQREYELRLASGLAGDTREEPKNLGDLVQVSVEAVFPAFTDNLKDYYNNLDQQGKLRDMYELDKGAPAPDGPGWVVELRGYTFHQAKQQFVIDALVGNLATHRREVNKEGTPAAAGGAPAPVAAPPKPGAAPPPAPAAASAPAGAKPAATIATGNADPILNRVTHVVLYQYEPVADPVPGQFKLINTSMVRSLLGSAAGGGAPGGGPGAMGAGGPGGAGGPNFGSWQALGSSVTAGSGGPGGGPGSYVPSAAMRAPIPSAAPGKPGVPGGEAPGKTLEASKRQARTEFIVMLIWREPTPSDKLMTPDEGGAGGGRPAAAPAPRAGGPPPGAGPKGPAAGD
jgi:type IV pilus assembly protein PilM